MKFLYPIIILGGIALIFGVLLAYLGKKLATKQDEKLEDTKGLLSGANCGGCGYAGCEAYAKALVEGKASLSSCNATSIESKVEIAKLLGLENKGEPIKMLVTCCGGDKCTNNYDYLGLDNCASVNTIAGGRKLCEFGCLGLGNCQKACNSNAIKIEGGVPKIDHESCILCGLCAKACPRGLIQAVPKSAKVGVVCVSRNKGKEVKSVCSAGCIACGMCAKNCPNQAITMVKNLPIINYDRCNGCGKCVEKCTCKTMRFLD